MNKKHKSILLEHNEIDVTIKINKCVRHFIFNPMIEKQKDIEKKFWMTTLATIKEKLYF